MLGKSLRSREWHVTGKPMYGQVPSLLSAQYIKERVLTALLLSRTALSKPSSSDYKLEDVQHCVSQADLTSAPALRHT